MNSSFLSKEIDIRDAQGWVARTVFILVLCVQPLYMNSRGYMLIAHQKYAFFAVYMLIISVLILIAWLHRRIKRKPRLISEDKPSLADLAILGFLLVTLLSAALTPHSREVAYWGLYARRDGALTQVFYIAVFFIVSRWYKPRVSDFVLFGVSAMLVSLIGILQFFGMDFLRLWESLRLPPGESVDSFTIQFRTTIGNINFVSTYVCAAVLLNGFLFVRFDTKWRYIWLVAGALCLWLMIISGSYSGMVGTVVALVLSVPFITQNKKRFGRFLILASSWTAVFFIHRLLYDTLVLGGDTAAMLILFAALTCVLLTAGIILKTASRPMRQGTEGRGQGTRNRGQESGIRGQETGVGEQGAENRGQGTEERRVGFLRRLFSFMVQPMYEAETSDESPVNWKRGVILIAVCILIGLVGIEVLGRSESTGPIYQAREMLRGNIQDDFGTNRIHIWRNALRAFPQRPLIGSGPDTFPAAFPDDAQLVFGEWYDKAHNEYLQILVCQGILGLLCYLVFLGAAFIKAVPHAFKNPLIMPILAAFTGYCVQAFFNISHPIVSQYLWLFAGLLTSKKVLDMLKPAIELSGKAQEVEATTHESNH